MQSILRKLILAPAVLAAAALTTGSAMAGTPINVPFGFSVAGKSFPAGLYLVERDSQGGFVTLANRDWSQSSSWRLGPGSPGPRENKVALKFAKMGDRRVLESIQYGPLITGKLDKKIDERERGADQLSRGR
jgi:hypothetical protein